MSNVYPNQELLHRARWVVPACLLAVLTAAGWLTPARVAQVPRAVESGTPASGLAALAPPENGTAERRDAGPALVAQELAVAAQSDEATAARVEDQTDVESSVSACRVSDAGPVPVAALETPFVPLGSEAGLYVRTLSDSARRVGLYTADGSTSPVLLEPGGGAMPTVTLLDVLHGGSWSLALSVNGGGEAAGSVGLIEGSERPVRWLENGEAVEMDTLPGGRGRVNGINGEGTMVGWSVDADGQVRATLWKDDGIPVDLNSRLPEGSAWELDQALSVSDSGEIHGVGRLNGEQRLFCFTPAVEAATAPH